MGRKLFRSVHEVAEAAEVSVATVSRVLNQHPNVSRQTRERVLAIIRDSGFRPNAIARRLAHGRSGLVCFLLSNRDIVHSFHSRVLKGAEDYCRQHHRQVVFTTAVYGPEDPMPGEVLPRIIHEHRAIEGLLIAGTNYPNLLRHVEKLELPHVLFGNNLVTGSLGLPRRRSVCFDEPGGGRMATEFLVQLGHRHVTFVGDLGQPWYRRRYEGYRAGMKARGSEAACVDIRDETGAAELGRRALPVVLRRFPKTSAILAQDDETACGLLDGLRKLRIQVPEEMSLVGYDDIAEIQYLQPALTTVRVPKEKMGWIMTDLLFQIIAGKKPRWSPPLELELVIRHSCARFQG